MLLLHLSLVLTVGYCIRIIVVLVVVAAGCCFVSVAAAAVAAVNVSLVSD